MTDAEKATAKAKAEEEAAALLAAGTEGGEGGATEVVTGFTFDPSELDNIGKEIEAEVRQKQVRAQMLYITGKMKAEAPDEGTAKAAEALENLIGQLSNGSAKAESGTDIRLGKIESLIATALSERGKSTEAGKEEGQVTTVTTPEKPGKIIRQSAPPQGGAPETETDKADPDAKIKEELKGVKTREEKFRILREHGRFTIKAA